jgi:microcin C transport system substrate-binding protein
MLHPNRAWTPAIAAVLLLGLAPAQAAADGPRHGLSAFGDLKVPADFKHFDWVNPDAPKGGRLSFIGTLARNTFDSFNDFILKGDAAQGLDLLFDSLMTRNVDEPDAVYGLVAHSAELAPDRSSVTFRMRPEARFADGSPVTSADVVFSFDILKEKGHPAYRLALLKDVVKAEAIDAHTVRFTFAVTTNRDLPPGVAGLPILSKAYYATRKFEETTLEPPLGSGPYKIGDFKQGTFVSYRRRDDYWGKDLPVNRGRFNFDEVRYDYFRDRTAALLALKAGEIDLREEFTARDWMTQYDVPAVKEGRLLDRGARLHAVGCAGLLSQHPPLQVCRPARAQGLRLRVRLPVHEQQPVQRPLHAHGELLRELNHESPGQAERHGACAAGAVSRSAAAGGVRRALPAAGVRRLRQGPQGPADGRQALERSRLADQGRQAHQRQGRGAGRGVPDRHRPILGAVLNYVKPETRLPVSVRRVEAAEYERRRKTFDSTCRTRYACADPGAELRNFWSSEAAKRSLTAGINSPAIDA